MGALGLLGMLIPEEWGGIGMSTVGFVAAMEQIGLADQSVAAAWQAHVTIGSLPLYLFGNESDRQDAVGRGALRLDHPDDSMCENPGFAAAGARPGRAPAPTGRSQLRAVPH